MTTRMIGALIMTHGDDKGLVLPPRSAPYQVVIVPIGRGRPGRGNAVRRQRTGRRLQRAGIRTHVDDRPQLSPGFKFNDWEMRGVPIRLELGPRDLAAGTALMSAAWLGAGAEDASPARRRAGPAGRRTGRVPGLAAAAGHRVPRRATRTVDSWDEFAAAVATGWALALHCGQPACEDDIKAATPPRRVSSR